MTKRKPDEEWIRQRRTLESLRGIRGNTRTVLLKIFSLKTCFMKQETMAAELGVHPVTISRALTRLSELGVITGRRRGGKETSEWWIDWKGVERYIQPPLFDDGDTAKCSVMILQNAKSRLNKMQCHDTANCSVPILLRKENDLSLNTERENRFASQEEKTEPAEAAEHRAGEIVRRFYDRKDVPMPPAKFSEADLDAVLARITLHGEPVVRQAIEEMDLSGRHYLHGALWQFDQAIKRIKSRRRAPKADDVVYVTAQELSDDHDIQAHWDSISDGERDSWRALARKRFPILAGKAAGDPWLEGPAAKLAHDGYAAATNASSTASSSSLPMAPNAAGNAAGPNTES